MRAVFILSGFLCTATTFADTTVTVNYGQPFADRWNYPFNPTPGVRPTASVFGNDAGANLFDNRDGQMIIEYSTAADIEPGLDPASYDVQSIVITLQFATDLALQYDDTVDGWQAFLPESDPNYVADSDPGQPIELFGTGYRNGWSLATWQENSAFAPPGANLLGYGLRNAFGFGTNPKGQWVDISNNVRDGFTPVPFAIGVVPGVELGEFIPLNAECVLVLDVGNPNVKAYVQQSLAAGKLSFSVTSLARVVQQGSVFPSFYCKESPLVQAGGAHAAKLDMTVAIATCGTGDLNCDGSVGPADLAILLGAWGTKDPAADLDGDGAVGPADLAMLLGLWG